MQDDPTAPDYEYPEPGRRLWHKILAIWVIVDPDASPAARAQDETRGEVLVAYEATGQLAVVKLADLRPRNT